MELSRRPCALNLMQSSRCSSPLPRLVGPFSRSFNPRTLWSRFPDTLGIVLVTVMPRVPADAPFLALTNAAEWPGVTMDLSLHNLARLAAGVSYNTWNQRRARLRGLDASARRVHWWHAASHDLIRRWHLVTRRSHPLREKKKELARWLFRKHAVLSHALASGEILQIDVLDAVVRRSFPFLSSCTGLHLRRYTLISASCCSFRSTSHSSRTTLYVHVPVSRDLQS